MELEDDTDLEQLASDIHDAGNGPANNQTHEIENKIITDQEVFLDKIHKQFVKRKVVDRGLLDKLRAAEAIGSEEEDNIANEPQQKQGARKLWDLLHGIPKEDFAGIVVPYLQKRYPHVTAGLRFKMMGNVFASSCCVSSCLRHSMRKRIKIQDLIDILKWTHCCSLEEYRRWMSITSGYCGDEEWQKVFTLLQHNAGNAKLCQDVKALLQQKKIDRPDRFPAVASSGFACTCHSMANLKRFDEEIYRFIFKRATALRYILGVDFFPVERHDPGLLAICKRLEDCQQKCDQQQIMMSLEVKFRKQKYKYATSGDELVTCLHTFAKLESSFL